MTDRPDLAALVEHPDRIREVPPEHVPALLCQLAALQTTLATRLVTGTATNSTLDTDMIDDVAEVARIARHSASWVRKNGHRLPGFSQPGGKGTRVAWSRRALEEWAASPGL
jgi:hypothetical protein